MAQVDELTKEIELRLGGQMVDVELDPEHYELSIKKSFEKYRQRSENAVEEAFVALELTREISEYTLDNEVIEVMTRIEAAVANQGNLDDEVFEEVEKCMLFAQKGGLEEEGVFWIRCCSCCQQQLHQTSARRATHMSDVWDQHFDPSTNANYYYHRETGRTTWTEPY